MKSKLTKCKACGAEIAKSAKLCPSCGAKQGKKARIWGTIVLVVGVCIVIGYLFGDPDNPQKVDGTTPDGAQPTVQAGKTDAPPAETVFGVGDKVELNNITATMTAVTESPGSQFNKPSDGNVFVLCSFEVENNSDKEINISSLMSFTAYVDDYSTNLSLSAILESEDNQLDGTVAAGKKMKGTVGYEAPKDWKAIEIRFTPSFWSLKDIKFTYSK